MFLILFPLMTPCVFLSFFLPFSISSFVLPFSPSFILPFSSSFLLLPPPPSLLRQMKLHAELSGLEAADHTNQPEMLHLERPFLLVGCCLLHRGALACSHLCPSDLKEVVLLLHSYRLLELTASGNVSQIVIWKEVCACMYVIGVFICMYVPLTKCTICMSY